MKTTRLKIVSCKNGWAVYDFDAEPGMPVCKDSTTTQYGPSYVFNSPAELAKAVANLVQFGGIEKPVAEPIKVSEIVGLQSHMRPVSEFITPTLADVGSPHVTLWFRFTTAHGLADRFCDHEDNSCGKNNLGEKTNIFKWMHQVGAAYFRPLAVGELPN